MRTYIVSFVCAIFALTACGDASDTDPNVVYLAPPCSTLPHADIERTDAGECLLHCDANWGDCDGDPDNGCETNLELPENCGACGLTCGAGQNCGTGCNETYSCYPSATNCGCVPETEDDKACMSQTGADAAYALSCIEGASIPDGCVKSASLSGNGMVLCCTK